MSDSVFDFDEVASKLKPLVPEVDAALSEERELYDQYKVWEAVAKEKIPDLLLCQIFPPAIEEESIVMQRFLGKWGNLSVEAVAKICLICRWLKPRLVFEIGTFTGMTTYQIAQNCSKGTYIFTLDLPPNSTSQYEMSSMDRHVSSHFEGKLGTQTGCYFADKLGLYNIKQLWGDSATFDFSSFYHKVDLVFIDAAHDYENKKSDTKNALRMVKPGGIIIWDNYKDPVNPYCTKFLSELNLPLFSLKGTNLVIYRHENSDFS
jgi:predicted O-methyltransferase YrrM